MSRFKQSFSWWSFCGRGVEAEELLRAARAIGYEGVELIPPELWGRAREAGLRIASHDGHHSIDRGLNDRVEHARIAAEIRTSLSGAVANGVPSLIVFAGSRWPGISDEKGAESTAECLRLVAGDAESAGVTLVLELLNSKIDHKGYQADRTAWARRVCELTGSAQVKILYDIYHMQIMEGDLIRTIEENATWIGHYHTAGCPGRQDLDEDQEIFYPAVFRAIAKTGYSGYVTHEFIPKGNPVEALAAAYKMCSEA